MWEDLLAEDKLEYKKMILAFASLTEMFAQKEDDDTIPAPIINTKYQETVFQKVFGAFAEDIGNTSYDASLIHPKTSEKYLIGIKTFGIASGDQKIAQFKTNHDEWSDIINKMRSNSFNPDGSVKPKAEIDRINGELYLQLATKIAVIRNKRIDSSISNIRGFRITGNEDFESVYHVLMPSKKGDEPVIYVGETSYDHINIDEIHVLGCTKADKPTNFDFTDGNHRYKYTSADSQLLMDFDNKEIVVEKWDVKYAEDAYAIFENIASKVYSEPEQLVEESYCWKITNEDGEVERFSGFNSFYGTGSKMSLSERNPRIDRLFDKYRDVIDNADLKAVTDKLRTYLVEKSSDPLKQDKIDLRNEIKHDLESLGNKEFEDDVLKLVYRPVSELYIPLPDSKNFHKAHPDFFSKGLGNLNLSKIKDVPVELRKFSLVFEPSGEKLEAYITQENGKGIESIDSQSILGEWILRRIFQLDEYEPLTRMRLDEIGINGIRVFKFKGSPEVHFQFIWIDDDNLPDDYLF